MENTYQRSRVYKLIDAGRTKCYIGSTTTSLSVRTSHHRDHYRACLNGRHNNMSVFRLFDEFQPENCKIELIETFPCNSREELLQREGFHIQQTECINKCVAGRSVNQWKLDHKERTRAYYEKSREKDIERARNRYEAKREQINEARMALAKCECGCEVRRDHLAQHRQTKKHKDLMFSIDVRNQGGITEANKE